MPRPSTYTDLTGQRFGKLLVLQEVPKSERKKRWYLTRCDCGEETEKRGYSLAHDLTHSCGCLQREASAAAQRRYTENPALNMKVSQYIFNAKRKKVPLSLSRTELADLMKQPCHYCGQVPSDLAKRRSHSVFCNGIDRVDNALGYTKDNSVSCCSACNMAKRVMSKAEFLSWVTRVYNHSIHGRR